MNRWSSSDGYTSQEVSRRVELPGTLRRPKSQTIRFEKESPVREASFVRRHRLVGTPVSPDSRNDTPSSETDGLDV